MPLKLTYEDSTQSLLQLFNFKKNIIEEIEENVDDDIFENYRFDIKALKMNLSSNVQNLLHDYYYDNIERKSIIKYIFSEIEVWFNNNVATLFENDEEVNIEFIDINYDMIKYTLTTKDVDVLKKNIGKGMNSYGEFNWHLHSEEDKQQFVEDGWLALRELLHYCEACEGKPDIKLNSITCSLLWSSKINFDNLKEKAEELLQKEKNENS